MIFYVENLPAVFVHCQKIAFSCEILPTVGALTRKFVHFILKRLPLLALLPVEAKLKGRNSSSSTSLQDRFNRVLIECTHET